MHTSYTKHKHYHLLAPILHLFIKFCLFTPGLSFFLRSEWGGEWAINLQSGGPYSLSLWEAKMKIKNS